MQWLVGGEVLELWKTDVKQWLSEFIIAITHKSHLCAAGHIVMCCIIFSSHNLSPHHHHPLPPPHLSTIVFTARTISLPIICLPTPSRPVSWDIIYQRHQVRSTCCNPQPLLSIIIYFMPTNICSLLPLQRITVALHYTPTWIIR